MSYDKLSATERKFALRYVSNGGQCREAFTYAIKTDKLSHGQITNRSIEMINRPHVRRYIQDLRTEISGSALYDVQQLFNDLVLIATADPDEIIGWRVGCCRHCYGVEHGYQWRDENELARAQASAIDSGSKILPDASGGFGFNFQLHPHPHCTHCRGEGVGRVRVADTSQLSPGGRRLFQGVKIGKDGQLEVKLRNQDEAVKNIMRMLGVYNPAAMLNPPKLVRPVQDVPATGTEIERVPTDPGLAQQFYQNLVNGINKNVH